MPADVPCPLCGESRYRVFSERTRNRIVVCRGCGLYYVTPLPEAEAVERAVQHSDKYTEDQLAKEAFFRRRAVQVLEDVERRRGGPGRLLDVGCAIGSELAVARERGWEAIGLELSASSLAVARSRGHDVREQTLEGSGFAEARFDLVTLNHVLEHIPRPSAVLAEIHRVLAQDGLLFVAVPNVRTWWFYVKRRRYGWTFQDDHFLHFSVDTLARLLRAHGFEVVDERTSRWLDYHEPPESRGPLWRALDAFAERHDLGIEIFCLARRRETTTSEAPPRF